MFHIKGKNQRGIILAILLLANIAMVGVGIASPGLRITVSTDKQSYYLRQKVTVYGNLTLDASPVEDGLVALQIRNPYHSTIICRTLSTGIIPTKDWKIKIVDVVPCDKNFNPKNEFKPGNWFYVNVTGRNDDAYERSVTLTVSLYDGNQNPIGFSSISFTALAGTIFSSQPQVWIPAWAYIGNATVYANVYTGYPEGRGCPYSPEASATFQIISVETSSLGVQSSYGSAGQETLQSDGSYSTSFRISPEPVVGQYMVYVSSIYIGEMAYTFTSFEVKSASYPPQASFIYTPPEPYVNMTVTFDASASTPDGGVIINYTWNFGDNTPIVTETDPITTHKYSKSGTYTVTLNVTDSEGLWCTTSKPIEILPPSGPTAVFGWTPIKPYVNQPVTFDARASRRGWNGTDWAPIVSYKWNFGDGNITTVTNPTITHVYRTVGNYTVSLNVTDIRGLWSFTSHIVEVTKVPGLGPWDVNGDGIVDITDIVIVALAYGSAPVDNPETGWDDTLNWNPIADVNGDLVVDIGDIVIVAIHFGESIP